MPVFRNELQEHKNSGTVKPQTLTTLTQNCRANFISTRLKRLPWFSAERAESNGNGWGQPHCRSILLIHHFRVLLVQIVRNYVKYLQITFYHITRESPFSGTHTKKRKNTKGTKDAVSLMMLLTCGSTTWGSFLAISDAHGTKCLKAMTRRNS